MPEGLAAVSQTAALFKASQQPCVLQITGYSSSTGSRVKNILLSHHRAEIVQKALIENGVPAERITIRGLGPDSPIGDNATIAGRRANQRVEVEFLPLER